MNTFVRSVRGVLHKCGFDFIRYREPSEARNILNAYSAFRLLKRTALNVDDEGLRGFANLFIENAWRLEEFSRSQIFQDVFVLTLLKERKHGFFVEFGAANGIDLSNTFILEKKYGWHGILAEPALCWHDTLRRNRDCTIDTRCVWRHSQETARFNEVEYPELSTIDQFSTGDNLRSTRSVGKIYQVETISLMDLLEQHSAPSHINYISIDTEGSEFDIIDEFDFSRYTFDVITIEHNFGNNKNRINDLLDKVGYRRVLSSLSIFDAWFVHKDYDFSWTA